MSEDVYANDRRRAVPFDPHRFEREAAAGQRRSLAETFQAIHAENHWGSAAVSGAGADDAQTAILRAALPNLFAEWQVKTLLDVPCGDFSWMAQVDLAGLDYLGLDVVPALIAENQRRYGGPGRHFRVCDATTEPLPAADLLLCRDLLVHFSFADIHCLLQNVQRSGIRYLLTTTFPETSANEEITTGDWRTLNLQRPPFDFPQPLYLLNEGCTEGEGRFQDKSLGLWRVADLPR